MGRRRGFFAELQHQQRLAEQRQRREQVAAVREYNRAVREHERAVRDHERAVREHDKAVLRVHQEMQRASAEMMTAEAADTFEQIDSILAATLDVDDYVDIESLKQAVEHPPFGREDLRRPLPLPTLERPPAEPMFQPPPEPAGLKKVFGKKAHAEAVEAARLAWASSHEQWTKYVNQVLPAKNAERQAQHAAAEKRRREELAAAEADYQQRCAERQRTVEEANKQLDIFRQALADGDPDAVDEYVGLVLSNSVYPDAFAVDHDYKFDAGFGELTVDVTVPAPADIPTVKAYKYVAASDEIRETNCTQNEQRDRYNGAVAAVAVRTFHEIFEADHQKRIKTVSLTVKAIAINPATGLEEEFVFVRAAADRDEFTRFELSNVEPAETLAHMRSSVSKNAFDLKPVSTARGVR
jgi:restriction system protein